MRMTRVPFAACVERRGTGRPLPAENGRDVALDTRAGGDQLSPPSADAAKKTSNVSGSRASRVSYHITPTVPSLFTAKAGWNCDTWARDSGAMSLGTLQVLPWSDDHRATSRLPAPT